ncbi:MAG: Lrp/AsnC family transcriptional regulator [Candidatus Omnitrophota bacterium]
MQNKDIRILNKLQTAYPLVKRPYLKLAKQIGLSERDVFKKISAFRKKKIIRRIGPVFNNEKIGYKTTLIAMKVPAGQVKAASQIINRIPYVSHNYLRDGEYNIWFTISASTQKELKQLIRVICRKTKISDILNLPAEQMFKINTNFNVKI